MLVNRGTTLSATLQVGQLMPILQRQFSATAAATCVRIINGRCTYQFELCEDWEFICHSELRKMELHPIKLITLYYSIA